MIQASVEVIPEHRGLIVATPDPWLVLQKIPTAFDLGDQLIGMPHGVDECTRLAYLGIRAPSPMRHYYRWPREQNRVPHPFEHQYETSGFMVTYPRSFVLNDIGTGKTLTTSWAMDYLIEICAGHRGLIVAPLSTLERVWGDTLFMHFPHRSFVVLHGSAARRKRLLAQDKDFYIINHDGVGVIKKELADRSDIDMVALDEIAIYRNKQTTKWKDIEDFIHPQGKPAKPWVWGLTGAPIPNSPEDAYGQCRLITPATVPKYFTQWRNTVMEHQSTYIWTPRPDAIKTVYEAMRPAIRYTRDECLDLPPCIYQTRDVELSKEQTLHYKAVMKELYTEVQGGKVTAMNEGVKLSKLMQIAAGCVYDSTGVPREIMMDGVGNRLETLMEIIDTINEKIIVFVPFTAVTGMLARALNKHWNFAVVTGETPIKERNKIFQDFQNPAIDIDIIAHPGCMAHGLTLTEASTIIWYAPLDSNDTFMQANGRITRQGQHYTANIIMLAGSAVERKVYKRLEARGHLQGLLLSMVAANEL